jgi:hypothetical protein
MNGFLFRVVIALLAFLFGITAAGFWQIYSYVPEVGISDIEITLVCSFKTD